MLSELEAKELIVAFTMMVEEAPYDRGEVDEDTLESVALSADELDFPYVGNVVVDKSFADSVEDSVTEATVLLLLECPYAEMEWDVVDEAAGEISIDEKDEVVAMLLALVVPDPP